MSADPEPAPLPDVVLVGGVATTPDRAAPGRDLYRSPLFERRRRYAEATGRPWFVLSGRWGLVRPDEIVAASDLDLADQSRELRWAWGEFVTAQLATALGPLAGRVVELHAGQAQRSALTAPLRNRDARATSPGTDDLAWYDDRAAASPAAVPAAADGLLAALADPAGRLSVETLLARGERAFNAPGLYAWWVDDHGARQLSAGLGTRVSPGLLYAGRAGNLWQELVLTHLAGTADSSAFRRALAACLDGPLGLTGQSDPRLSSWIPAHLAVTPIPLPDAASLTAVEDDVLTHLDAPLTLDGTPPTPARDRLASLLGT
jgi:hypothetical protein